MKIFKDAKGREWEIELTLGAIIRVREAIGIDLLYIDDGVERVEGPDGPRYQMTKIPLKSEAEILATKLVTDRAILMDILYTLLEPQIGKHNLTKDNAWDGFDGATMKAMHQAFYGELTDFFQQDGQTQIVRLLEAQEKVVMAQTAMAERVIKNLDDPMMDRLIDGILSGKSQDELASILVRSALDK